MTPRLGKHFFSAGFRQDAQDSRSASHAESNFTRGSSPTVGSCAGTPNHDQNTGGRGWVGWGGYRQGGGDSSRALSTDWSGCFRAPERPDLGEWRLVEVPPHLRGRVQTWRDGNRCGARAQVFIPTNLLQMTHF